MSQTPGWFLPLVITIGILAAVFGSRIVASVLQDLFPHMPQLAVTLLSPLLPLALAGLALLGLIRWRRWT